MLDTRIVTNGERQYVRHINSLLVQFTDCRVHKSRPGQIRQFGRYFVRDEKTNHVVRDGINNLKDLFQLELDTERDLELAEWSKYFGSMRDRQ